MQILNKVIYVTDQRKKPVNNYSTRDQVLKVASQFMYDMSLLTLACLALQPKEARNKVMFCIVLP